MPLYDQLHVFIDESGDFINLRPHDKLLLGGVFFWGDYNEEQAGDPKVDWDLKAIVLGAMHEAYELTDADKLDYHNLHYYEQSLIDGDQRYWDKKNDFLMRVRDGLSKSQYWDRLEGFVIDHVADVYGASDVLNENVLDNRYERMLELLIDSVLLRALYSGANRLTQSGSVHFHIASRTSVLEYRTANQKNEIIDRLREFGISEGKGPRQYENKKSRQEKYGGTITIHSLLNSKELSSKVDKLIGNLQEDVYDVNLKQRPTIEEIIYENNFVGMANKLARNQRALNEERLSKLSDMGYYLADNFLGQYRNRGRDNLFIVPFSPGLNSWSYVDTTQFINRALLNLQRRSNEYFWLTINQHPEAADNQVFTDFLTNLSAERVDLILEGYPNALDRIRKDVDKPGLGELARFRKVHDVFQRVDRILRSKNPAKYSQALNDSLDLINYQVRITLANHLGRPLAALKFVQSYQELITDPERNVFEAFSLEEELAFRTEMALRCAVTYADQFDYVNASNLIEEAREQQEIACETFKDLATKLSLSPRKTPPLLGRCYSSLGQHQAFQGNFTAAVELFNKAIDIFDDYGSPKDVEYDLIFKGHVACDMARDANDDKTREETARSLWECVSQGLNLPLWKDLAAMEKLATENRYTFALFVKAMAFFATTSEIREFLNVWLPASSLYRQMNNSSKGDSFEHPYELICQSIGILYERSDGPAVTEELRAKIRALAVQYYDKGYAFSQNGGETIRVLGLASRARSLFLRNPDVDEWRAWNTELEALLALFKPECVDAVFGADRGAIAEGEEFATSEEYRAKAEQFIQAIRFNYW